MSSLVALTLYAASPARLATFWSALLDLPIDPGDAAAMASGTLPDAMAILLGDRHGLHLWVSPAESMPPVHGRIHLEVQLEDGDPARIAVLGGAHVRDDPGGRWAVYADPEGNEFCGLPPRAGARSSGQGAPTACAQR